MEKRITVAFGALAIILLPSSLIAEQIEYTFSGTVTLVDRFPETLVGDHVQGYFSYSTNAIGQSLDGSLIFKNNDFFGYLSSPPSNISLSLPGLFATTNGSLLATIINNGIGVDLREYSFVLSDGYLPMLSGGTIIVNSEAAIGVLGIGFDDRSSSRSASFDLPTELQLDSFLSASGSLELLRADGDVKSRILFSIDTLARIVPEPTSLILVAGLFLVPSILQRSQSVG